MSEVADWHIAQEMPGTQDVPDLTAKELFRTCEVRRVFRLVAPLTAFWGFSYERVLLCTRRTFHSGRHASGDGRLIRAVWKEKA